MKKKTLVRFLLAIFLVAISGRIIYVNATALKTSTEIYELGETVEYDGSFTDLATENTAGYSVTVESAEVLTYKEFMKRFEKPEDYLAENSRRSTVFLKLKFRNDGNETGAVSVNRLFLYNEPLSEYFSFHATYFSVANPQIEQGLQAVRIQPGTEYTIFFPYVLEYGEAHKSYLDLRKADEKFTFYLRISTYPVKKYIKMEL